jgi:hypothetical protein
LIIFDELELGGELELEGGGTCDGMCDGTGMERGTPMLAVAVTGGRGGPKTGRIGIWDDWDGG